MVLYGFFFFLGGEGGSTKSKVLQSKRIHRYEYEHKSNTLHSAIMCIFININHLELVCIEVSFCVWMSGVGRGCIICVIFINQIPT